MKYIEKWEDLSEVAWYYIDVDSEIIYEGLRGCNESKRRNRISTRLEAEWVLALAQITQILWPNWYNIPERSKIWYYADLSETQDSHYREKRCSLMAFDTKEKRDHFVEHHQDLIYKVKAFYIT